MNAHAAGVIYDSVNTLQSGECVSRDRLNFSDEELIRRCAQGENDALEELTRRYQPSLARFMARLLASPEDIEDALLTVFLRAWQYANRFQYRARVKTWLYRIAINVVYDIQKQNKARAARSFDAPVENYFAQGNVEAEALRHIEQDAQAQALANALPRLPDTDRLLLTLYYYEEMDYEQMQAVTQLSYTVLKMRLTRARRRLRQLLEAQEAGQ